MKDAAVVPVKSLGDAKKRLSNHLDSHDRRRLVLAMLDDVLQALDHSSVFAEILVISPDESLDKEIRKNGGVFVKQKGIGLNAAIRQATREVSSIGASTMTTVLADLPLAEAKDFRELSHISRESPRVVLAPSLKGGTNVMVRSPPGIIANAYGRWSYAKHLRTGQKKGLPVYSVSNSRLSFDLDTFQDIKTLKHLDSSGQTHAGRLATEIIHPFSKLKNG